MKRFVVPFLAVLAFLTPLTAHAEWVTKEVKWRISGIGPTGVSTAIWIRDTTVTSIGPVDTTASFSLNDAMVPPRGIGMPAGVATTGNGVLASADTCIIAWVMVAPDSSAIPTPAFTSATMLVDGRVGGFGAINSLSAGWVKADSCLINGAAGGTMILGDHTLSFPIRSISPYGTVFRFEELRARVTGLGGATGLAAARVFVRYYRPDVAQHY